MARKPTTRKTSLKDGILYPVVQLPQTRQPHRVRKCELSFSDGIVSVVKGADNVWRCPRCQDEFGSVAWRLKEHAISGACAGKPQGTSVRQSASTKARLRIPARTGGEEPQDIEYIARRVRPAEPEDEETLDYIEVLMKLENEGEQEADIHNSMNSQGDINTSQQEVIEQPTRAQEEASILEDPKLSQTLDVEPDITHPASTYAGNNELGATVTGANGDASSLTGVQRMEIVGNDAPSQCVSAFRSLSLVADEPAAASEAPASTTLHSTHVAPSHGSDSGAIMQPPSLVTSHTWSAAPGTQALHPPEPTQTSFTSYPDTVPQALRGFLDTLLVKRDFLPEIFIQREFDTEEALNLLCQSSQEEEYHWLIQEIQAKSHLVSLAVKKGLRAREENLKKLIVVDL